MTPRLFRSAIIVVIASSVVGLGVGALGQQREVSQAAPAAISIGVDADPSGNSATTLGKIDSCVSVNSGDTFQMDIVITDVSKLLALEVPFAYDVSVVEVTDRDVGMFLAASPGSDVLDISDDRPWVHDGEAIYFPRAFDYGPPEAADSGSGVLVRLTLKAVGPGISPARFAFFDYEPNGKLDIGPLLRDVDTNLIGDVNGDGFFDGRILDAQIAVDRPCSEAPPIETRTPVTPGPKTATAEGTGTPAVTVTTTTAAATGMATAAASPTRATATPAGGPSGESGGEGIPWAVVGPLIGAGAVVVLGAAFVLLRVRGR